MQQQVEQVERLNAQGEFQRALDLLSSLDGSYAKVMVEQGKAHAGLSNFSQAAHFFQAASQAYAKLDKLQQAPPPPASAAVKEVTAPQLKSADLQTKHDWYQTAEQVFVSFPHKNVSPADVSADFAADKFRLTLRDKFEFEISPFAQIDPEKSSYKVTKFKIEVTLHKQVPNATWPRLDQAPLVSGQQQTLPSAYSSKKKWDTEVQALEEEGPDDDPMNTFLKKLYKDADEETRMAMKKSMQTSGGTVLTTNWKEAKDKDFSKEIKPPAGQVFKDWEGRVIAKSDSLT